MRRPLFPYCFLRSSLYIISVFFITQTTTAQSVGIGTTTPDASAKLDVGGTTQGILIPRLTTTQRSAISSPATGLLLFQTDGTPGFYYYNGSVWINLTNGYQANSQGVAISSFYGLTSTLAGSGSSGTTDGAGSAASFNWPFGVASDAFGNVYVSDTYSHEIRKITSSGVVSTLAGSTTSGSTDGTGTAASFYYPAGVATDASGNVYVGDAGNRKIRKITSGGVVTTLAGSGSLGSADGTGTAASFNYPSSVATDASGNVYVGDRLDNKIRKITPGGVVTTLAGSGTAGAADGTGTAASFNYPYGVATDASGNVYVADYNNNKIRKITPGGVVTTLAGSGTAGATDGTGTAASFNNPSGVATDVSGNIYVADRTNQKIRKITPGGVVTTLAGSGSLGSADGTSAAASFNYPSSVATDASGNVYVADQFNNKIRKIIAQ